MYCTALSHFLEFISSLVLRDNTHFSFKVKIILKYFNLYLLILYNVPVDPFFSKNMQIASKQIV